MADFLNRILRRSTTAQLNSNKNEKTKTQNSVIIN